MAGADDVVKAALKLIFSGSKAVDEAGVPVRYYHGTTKDLPVIKPGTYFTEDPGEGSAYTFWTDLKNAEKHKGKYSVISAPELAGKRLEYFGTISDIDDPKVGEFYATDNGIMRYKGNGTWDVASDVGIDSGSLDMSDYTIGIKPYDNSEAAKQMVDEYEEAVKRVYPGGVGGNVIPAYLNVKNPKEMSPLEGNRFGERLGADPKWVADEIERLKAQGYDSIVTTSDDPFYAMEGKKPPKQYVIFDPTQAKSAIGNTGEYDFTNPDITKSSGGSIRQGYQTKGRVVGDIVDQALKLVAGSDPQKTVKAYKLFRQKEGKLYPLFVDANEEVALGQWLKAKAGEQAASGKVKSKLGELAYRPGWHAGDLPIATHIGARSHKDPKLPPDTRPSEQVWAEVEMADDVDWQKVANERARITKKGTPDPKTAQITDQVPYGGYYRYKTNPNMTDNWLIGGDMRVNRVLTDDEVKAINDAAGVADLPRREGYGPGGWVDDVVKMAGKVIGGESEEATKAFRMPRVRPSTDNIHDVGSANFDYYDVVGNKTMPIKDVFGGVNLSMPDQRARVDALKAAMSDPDKGYISRIVVDDEGNVIEGQHRLDAFRELGASEIPVTMLRDKSRGVDVVALRSAIQQQGGIHPDQTNQIVDMLLEGNPEEYEPPQGFEKWWNAGVGEYNKQRGRIAKGGGGSFLDDVVKMAGKVISGEGEDAAKAGIRAYQGSPHNFAAERLVRFPTGKEEYLVGQPDVLPDVPEGAEVVQDFPLGRMRMDKIGTGEGAQAYGHGLYYAEHEPVARGYRDALQFGPVPAKTTYTPDERARGVLNITGGDIPLAISHLEYGLSQAKTEDKIKSISETIRILKENPPQPSGKMYEVNINADPATFLDWNKPLSEQGGVDRFAKLPEFARPLDAEEAENLIGQRLHQRLANKLGEGGASSTLREAGIPGIKYLDAGSRSAGDGTRNYVVFDDKLISIIRKYGIAGASAMLGYNLMEQLDPKQALAASMADQDYQASRPQRSMGGNNSISGALNVARGLYGDR